MKQLSKKQYEEAPSIVQAIYYAGMNKEPIQPEIYNKAITMYPEYFPEEIADREAIKENERIWNTVVPIEVKESFNNAVELLRDDVLKDRPLKSDFEVLRAKVKDPKKFEEYTKFMEKATLKLEKEQKKLYNKYFKEYGLKA